MIILIDSGVLGQLCNLNSTDKTIVLNEWFYTQLIRGRALFSSELCDYEVRRSLCLNFEKGGKPDGLRALERLRSEGSIEFTAVNGEIVSLAASLWAKAQIEDKSTALAHSLDIDLIICATALWLKQEYPGREIITVTTNVKHLSRFINAVEWSDI
jgi:hypothetical protein